MKRAGLDRVAVDNFLASVFASGESTHEAFENAKADAKSYGWSDATLKAVIDGIAERAARRPS